MADQNVVTVQAGGGGHPLSLPQGQRVGFVGPDGLDPSRVRHTDFLAEVYRRDFENYRRRFYPVEDELLGSYRNIGDIREAQQQGLADIGSAFSRATEARDQRIRGLGLALTPRQEEDLNRRGELSKGLAEVEAMNRINRRFVDRDRELLTTGVAPRSSLSQAYGG